MPPLLSEEETHAMNYGNALDHDIISTDMLEDIRYGSHFHPNVN